MVKKGMYKLTKSDMTISIIKIQNMKGRVLQHLNETYTVQDTTPMHEITALIQSRMEHTVFDVKRCLKAGSMSPVFELSSGAKIQVFAGVSSWGDCDNE